MYFHDNGQRSKQNGPSCDRRSEASRTTTCIYIYIWIYLFIVPAGHSVQEARPEGRAPGHAGVSMTLWPVSEH